jgi:site-specific recombinase XerD
MANRTLDLLRRIYKWGIEEDIVVASPCYPIRKPGEEHTRDRILTEDEIKKVWMTRHDRPYPLTRFKAKSKNNIFGGNGS